MKNTVITLLFSLTLSVQCSTPKNTQLTLEPSAPYLHEQESYDQYSVEPSAPEQSAQLVMIVDMHGFKQTITYDCDQDVQRFHADVEMIVQQVQSIVQQEFNQDVRPWLREKLIDTLYENLHGAEYVIHMTLNNNECSITKVSTTDAQDLVQYAYTPQVVKPQSIAKHGLYSRLRNRVSHLYRTLFN